MDNPRRGFCDCTTGGIHCSTEATLVPDEVGKACCSQPGSCSAAFWQEPRDTLLQLEVSGLEDASTAVIWLPASALPMRFARMFDRPAMALGRLAAVRWGLGELDPWVGHLRQHGHVTRPLRLSHQACGEHLECQYTRHCRLARSDLLTLRSCIASSPCPHMRVLLKWA